MRRQEQSVADLAADGRRDRLPEHARHCGRAKNAAADAAARSIATAERLHRRREGRQGRRQDRQHRSRRRTSRSTSPASTRTTSRRSSACRPGTSRSPPRAMASDQANGAIGAMPLLFNAEAFPGAVCNEAGHRLHAGGLPAARHRQRGRAPGRHPVQLDDLLHGERQPVQRELERCRRDIINGGGNATTVSTSTTTSARSTRARTPRCSTTLRQHIGETCSRSRSSTTTGQMVGCGYFKLLDVEGAQRQGHHAATSSRRSTARSSSSRRPAATRRSSPASIGSRS